MRTLTFLLSVSFFVISLDSHAGIFRRLFGRQSSAVTYTFSRPPMAGYGSGCGGGYCVPRPNFAIGPQTHSVSAEQRFAPSYVPPTYASPVPSQGYHFYSPRPSRLWRRN